MVKKPRRIWLKLVAILGGLLIASEITVRVIAALSGPAAEEGEDHQSSKMLSIRAFDEMLARIPDDPNRVRIVFLGDSYTKGVAGIKPDQTLVHHAGVLLEKWRPGRYVAINLGVSGNDSIGEWGVYNRLRDRARADVVVQVISPRGLDINVCTELFAIQEYCGKRLWISRYSMLLDKAEENIRFYIGKGRLLDYMSGGATQEQRETAWRIFLGETIATKKLVEEGGAVYVMVRFPLLGLGGAYGLNDLHRRGAALAADLHAPYLDLLDAYRGKDLGKMGVYEGDLHPGIEAHVIAGKAVADFLTQSVLPKIPGPTTDKARKSRTPEEIAAAESQHYEEILRVYPDCKAARHWLSRLRAESDLPKTP